MQEVFDLPVAARIRAFKALGEAMAHIDSEELAEVVQQAKSYNGWFDSGSVLHAIRGLTHYLAADKVEKWLSAYQLPAATVPRQVGLVLAGNIPLAGIHDMLCVLMSGHKFLAKLSSKDPFLPKFVMEKLIAIEPEFAPLVSYPEGTIPQMEAVIATGSDNSARYFDYYFGRYPNIIRKNRTSCAVLRGGESVEALQALGEDILRYFGLGCRNVGKVYIHADVDPRLLMAAIESLAQQAMLNHKYVNNYEYNKSIYLVNGLPHFDSGGLLMKESADLFAPVSVLLYEFYTEEAQLAAKLDAQALQLQCTVSEGGWWPGSLPFGQAQYPDLWDYADGIDTLQFLLGLHADAKQ